MSFPLSPADLFAAAVTAQVLATGAALHHYYRPSTRSAHRPQLVVAADAVYAVLLAAAAVWSDHRHEHQNYTAFYFCAVLFASRTVLAALTARRAAKTAAPADDPTGSPEAAPGVYTVTAYRNIAPGDYGRFRSGDPLRPITTDGGGAPLRLVFRTGVADPRDAADAARTVSRRYRSDDNGQGWPLTGPLALADVLTVTAPDGTSTHLSVAPVGFAELHPNDLTIPTPARRTR